METKGIIFNVYPDSIGNKLSGLVKFLKNEKMKNIFTNIYILPSVFNSDLDRGFSIIDYSLNKSLATKEDIDNLYKLGIGLKLDFILNHASVLSKEFKDIIKNGQNSKYADFFINWNKFWEGHGKMTEEGYIQPDEEYIKDMFFRKEGLPILMVRMPDGTNVPYWNTFYQEIKYPSLDEQDIMEICNIQYAQANKILKSLNENIKNNRVIEEIEIEDNEVKKLLTDYMEKNRKYLGQMDLNINSPLVWEYYQDVLNTLKAYGAKIVRLDAFAYAPKKVGEKNFLNIPDTWELLSKIDKLAKEYSLSLLPEIHASYEEKIYKTVSDKGYMTYDFFLPGLILDAFERKSGKYLKSWADEIIKDDLNVVNMLGCHDGIPLLDLKGLLPEKDIESLIDKIVARGGYVKNLHGKKNVYYQVNATYYSALGEIDEKLLMARAIQLFMPGIPQVWYLDLFAGKNDYEAVRNAGAGGHKEINRTNLEFEKVISLLDKDIVMKQLKMLEFRNNFKAFAGADKINIENSDSKFSIEWISDKYKAYLDINFKDLSFNMKGYENSMEVFSLNI